MPLILTLAAVLALPLVEALANTMSPMPSFSQAASFGYTRHEVVVCPGISLSMYEGDLDTQEALVSLALEESVAKEAPEADPYGCVLWPAALPVARRVVDLVRAGSVSCVVEIGSGTGLVSLAAVAAGAPRVVATDFNALTLDLLNGAVDLNFQGDKDSRRSHIQTALFDVTDTAVPLPTWVEEPFLAAKTAREEGVAIPPAEEASSRGGSGGLLVCADMLYSPRTSRAVARRCAEAWALGWRVLVGDCGRPGAVAFVKELELLGLVSLVGLEGDPLQAFTPVTGHTLAAPRNSLIATQHDREDPISVGMLELS